MTYREPLLTALVATLIAVAASSFANSMTTTQRFFPTGAQSTLEDAVLSNDPQGITRAVSHGASVNAKGKQDVTPLMIAVDRQCANAANALLAAGANPNDKAIDGNGPVSLAVKSHAAKPNGQSVMLAVFRGGGDPDTRLPDGNPVLMQFIYEHDEKGLALMKSLGANLDITERSGRPLITNVAMAQDWDMVWAMIELGAQYDYEGGKSTQPLSKALKLTYPSPDSPLYPYKLKVWQLLKDKGFAVPDLLQAQVKPSVPPSP